MRSTDGGGLTAERLGLRLLELGVGDGASSTMVVGYLDKGANELKLWVLSRNARRPPHDWSPSFRDS